MAAPAQAQGVLERQIDTMMAEWGVTDAEMVVGYNIPEITKYARGLALARARGQVQEVPHLTWAGFTNALICRWFLGVGGLASEAITPASQPSKRPRSFVGLPQPTIPGHAD